MKRLIILLLIVGCGITKAQFINSYGLKLGIVNTKQDWNHSGLASIMNNYDIMSKSMTKLVLGGYFDHTFTTKLSFQSGIEYIQKGAQDSECRSGVTGDGSLPDCVTSTIGLDYLSIPIQIKYTHKYKNYSPYGLIGFKYDILINKKGSWLGGGILENINNSEYCLTYGIGIIKKIKEYNIGLEIRNSYPLSSTYSTDFLEIKNFTTDISLLIQP